MAHRIAVKRGRPSQAELEQLANDIHTDSETWKRLARRLNIKDSKITQIDNANTGLYEKAYNMLSFWKQANGPYATYAVLFDALTYGLVSCRELAEQYCCEN